MLDLTESYRAHIATLVDAYRRILAEHQLDAVVVTSGQAALRSRFDDQAWPLAITPTFAHWLPLPEADAVLVIDGDARPRLIRVDPGDYWESTPQAERDDFLAAFAVTTVGSVDAVAPLVPRGRIAVIGERVRGLDDAAHDPPALVAAVEAVRTRKTAYELACLAEASARAVRGHRHAAQRFVEHDDGELALHLGVLGAVGQADPDAPYQGIVARGPHAAVLHHTQYDRAAPTRAADSLLLDAGARYLGYNADITRTWVRGTTADAGRFGELIAAVDGAQQQICREVRAGDAYEALHDRAHVLLAEALIAIGLGRGSAQALVERGVTRALFPHGLGHSLGIQVHDVGMKLRAPRPDNRFLRNTSTIEVGQVFTIEPGCYVIDALVQPLARDDRRELLDWRAVDALRGFGGVRIEDNVVVTADGHRNLTRDAWAVAS